jgi:hypothetical protein
MIVGIVVRATIGHDLRFQTIIGNANFIRREVESWMVYSGSNFPYRGPQMGTELSFSANNRHPFGTDY